MRVDAEIGGLPQIREEIPDDEQINEMLARDEEEFALYQKMDEERLTVDRQYGTRLMREEEAPDWLRGDTTVVTEAYQREQEVLLLFLGKLPLSHNFLPSWLRVCFFGVCASSLMPPWVSPPSVSALFPTVGNSWPGGTRAQASILWGSFNGEAIYETCKFTKITPLLHW